jgi:hypothetical protein
MSGAWWATALIAGTIGAIFLIKTDPEIWLPTIIGIAFALAWTGYADIRRED